MDDLLLRRGTPGHTTTVLTRWGRETYQVWLNEAGNGWIARIVTLPNRIWSAKGGREALKFHGTTRDEAESAASAFIDEECLRTGRRVAPIMSVTLPADVAMDDADETGKPAPRHMRRLLVRFGAGTDLWPGLTGNLSETGMFIVTDRPANIGSRVEIDLRFPETAMQLGGEVVWNREGREAGRSLGFGVRLTECPEDYLRKVRALSPSASA